MTTLYFHNTRLTPEEFAELINTVSADFEIEDVPDCVNFSLVDSDLQLIPLSATKFTLFGLDERGVFCAQRAEEFKEYGPYAEEMEDFTLQELLEKLGYEWS